MAISLAVLLLAVSIAGQLLMETAQLFVGSTRESVATPVPQAVGRIRADVLASASFGIQLHADGTMDRLTLYGHPSGTVTYELLGGSLIRSIQPPGAEEPEDGTLLWRGVDGWMARSIVGWRPLLDLEIDYRASLGPQFLARIPGRQGARSTARVQRLYLLPRGGGLGSGW
jgi:hypothetical protein